MPLSSEERVRLRKECAHEIAGFMERSPARLFEDMAQWCEGNEIEHDVYGAGRLISCAANLAV